MKIILPTVRIVIPVLVLVLVALWYSGFAEVDDCLDAGGAYDYENRTCMMPERETYTPLAEREGGPLRLWICAFIVGAIPAGMVYGLIEAMIRKGRQG